jgi:hypothetical protein
MSGLSPLIASVLFLLLAAQVAHGTIFRNAVQAASGAAGFAALNVIAHGAIIVLALTIPVCRERLGRFKAVWLLTIAYGAVVIVATMRNVPGVTGARGLEALLVPLTILSLGSCLPILLGRKDYDRLFCGLVAMFALSAVVSLWLVLTERVTFFGQPLQVPPDRRGGALSASGLYVHRNTIGAFLQCVPAVALSLVAGRSAGERSRRSELIRRWVGIPALFLVFLHLALTFSRSSQIVALLSVLPFVAAGARERPRAARLLGAAIAIAAAIVLVSVTELRDYVGLGWSMRGRESIWRAVVEALGEHPWLGFGLLNFEFRTPYRSHTPHNVYLAQVAYFGVIGLGLFLGVLVAFGRLVRDTLRAARDRSTLAFALLLAGMLLQGLVEYIVTFPIFFANSMFWIVLGLAARDPRRTMPAGRSETT